MEACDMSFSPKLLLIGAQKHTLIKLEKMRVPYVLIQTRQDPVSFHQHNQIVFIDSYQDIAELLIQTQQLHKVYRFEAVVSFTEFGLYPAALIAEQLNIKGNAVFPVLHTRNKLKMRRLLEEHGFSTINYQYCNSIEDVGTFYDKINAPFILKPIDGAGSQGVCYVASEAHISSAWNWSTQNRPCQLIAEEYLLGKEYSVETLSINGQHEIIAITEKITTGEPHFIELGHASPACIDSRTHKAISKKILHFLDIIQHYTGPAHTEIKVQNNEIKIIESQTRMGGDQIWELTELTTGVDVISETIGHLLCLGKKVRKPEANAAAILFFAYESQQILSISGLANAQKQSGVLRTHCDLKSGQKLEKLTSSQSRQGYILGVGNDTTEAKSVVYKAMKKITIKTS